MRKWAKHDFFNVFLTSYNMFSQGSHNGVAVLMNFPQWFQYGFLWHWFKETFSHLEELNRFLIPIRQYISIFWSSKSVLPTEPLIRVAKNLFLQLGWKNYTSVSRFNMHLLEKALWDHRGLENLYNIRFS